MASPKSCAILGHSPMRFAWGFDEEAAECHEMKMELDQQITAYNLSRYGMGISFCSDTLVRHVPDDEGLVYYKLDHKDALREVNFYYKRGRYMPRVVSTFLEMI